MTRRDLLQRLLFGVGLMSALAFAPRSLLSTLLFEPDAPQVPPKALPVNPFQQDGKALVVMIHGPDPAVLVREALARLGGLERLYPSGKRILIKPNVVNDRPPPSTTNPAVLSAVLDLVKQTDPAELIVADSSGMLRFPTSDNLTETGLRQVAASHGVRVLALEEEPWVRVEPPAAASMRQYCVSQPVYDADLFINVPVVKTHKFAHYSCSLKNLVGIIHPRYRPSLRFLSGRWHEQIAELNLAVHPHLTIADATTMMIAGGPTSGTPADADIVLASGDRVAIDVVALALIRSYGAWPKVEGGSVWEQRQIKQARALGLGVNGPAEIELVIHTLAPKDEGFQRRADAVRADVMNG